MNKIIRGDLVWVPDGTPNYEPLRGVPIKGPVYGLVLEVKERPWPVIGDWLRVKLGGETYMLDSEDVRRINKEEAVND